MVTQDYTWLRQGKRAVVLLVGLAACKGILPAEVRAESLVCVDKLGREVHIQVPLQKAVFLQLYELIAALDIGDRVAAVGRHASDNDLLQAKDSLALGSIPQVGTSNDINVEMLLKIRPDAVITWTYKREAIQFLEDKGLPVIGLAPESLPELYDVLRLLGKLFAKENRAEKCIAEMEKILTLVKERVSTIPVNAKRKVVWLMGKPTSVVCARGVSADLTTFIHALNPAAAINQTTADISMERIISWNPDVIFIWGHAAYNVETVVSNSRWGSVTAVKERRVFKAPPWSTWSPRVAPLVLWMAKKTYPELFCDVDVLRLCEEFYQNVFGIPYHKVRGLDW